MTKKKKKIVAWKIPEYKTHTLISVELIDLSIHSESWELHKNSLLKSYFGQRNATMPRIQTPPGKTRDNKYYNNIMDSERLPRDNGQGTRSSVSCTIRAHDCR